MIFRVLLLLISFLTSTLLPGQQSAPVTEAMLKGKQGQERVDLLLKLTEQNIFSAADKATDYVEEAYRLSERLDYQPGLGQGGYYLGILMRDQRNLRRALRYAGRGLKAFEQLKDNARILECYELLTTIYQLQDRREKIEEFETKIRLLERSMQARKEIASLENVLKSKEDTIDLREAERTSILDTIAFVKEQNAAALNALEVAEQERLLGEAEILRLEKEAAETEREAAVLEKNAAFKSLELEQERNLRNMAYAIIAGLVMLLFVVWQRNSIVKARKKLVWKRNGFAGWRRSTS